MILLALVALELIGFVLVRSHPEIREMYSGAPLSERVHANMALFLLWPLLAIALCFERGGA